jgi:outer membrane immunogenic protein
MKKLLLATATVAAVAWGMAAPASAADLPARTYKAPPPAIAAVYDWSGFYIGINGGWGSGRSCWGFVGAGGLVTADGCATRSGGLLGGQIGYRWQTGPVVFGVEAQGDWANLRGSSVSIIAPAFTIGARTNGIGLFTGQLGYAWNNALLYAKGGAAVTGNTAFINTTAGGAAVALANATRWGGSLGVGFEYGFTPNWTAGIEYDHLWMGTANNSFSVVNPIVAGAANRVGMDVDMLTLRLNYKWGGYTPVVARY